MTNVQPGSSAPGAAQSNADVLAALRIGGEACNANGREDLAARLAGVSRAVSQPDVRVVVVGEFKQGKSSLINALLNSTICPVDDDIATAVPTAVSHGDEFEAVALLASTTDPNREPVPTPIQESEIRGYTTEMGFSRPDVVVKGVEIKLPRKLLANGLMLVDTPGVGGLGSAHSTAALGALSIADSVLFVSDASQEYTRTEIDFLHQARDLCPNIICLLTKTDFYPAWRRVLELNQGHLVRANVTADILPVSSVLRQHAIKSNDRDLNKDSGFAALVSVLKDRIVGESGQRDRVRARDEIVSVVGQLSAHLEAEKTALEDPDAATALVAELTEAKEKVDSLRAVASSWRTSLSDGFTDLSSNVEFDFRGRIKGVIADADAAIEASDPMESWAEFEPWLVARVSSEVVANYRYTTEQASSLATEIGSNFEADGDRALSSLDIHNPMKVIQSLGLTSDMDLKSVSAGNKGLTLLRSSYSGVLMFSMIGGMIFAPITAPLMVGAGIVFGRKGLKDESARLVAQRRGQARNAMRRYCDDVTFQVSKDSRDTLRRIQRQIRDHYTTRTDELQRSTSDALRAAADAERMGKVERQMRLKLIGSHLQKLGGLTGRAESLVQEAR